MTPSEARILAAGARELGVELDPDTVGRLDRFLALLAVWNRRIHLTGERDRKRLIEKHLIDSLAPVAHLPPHGTVVDIGSGAGFPGIILACVRPDLNVALVESRRRPTSFLREVIRTIPLSATRAFESRAEEAVRNPELSCRAAVVIARAIRLDAFLGLAAPLLAPRGQAIAMQTPRTARLAASVAAGHGLELARRRDYRLPGGAPRTLLVFRRTTDIQDTVS
jgi:16S rRNA (guanine527-N7)-methyltransferase